MLALFVEQNTGAYKISGKYVRIVLYQRLTLEFIEIIIFAGARDRKIVT